MDAEAQTEGRVKSLNRIGEGTGAGLRAQKKRNQTGNNPHTESEVFCAWQRTVPQEAVREPGAGEKPRLWARNFQAEIRAVENSP